MPEYKASYDISIHAPARGATSGERGQSPLRIISIHAPARGATLCVRLGRSKRMISIHAPARGATCLFFHGRFTTMISIHAPARGATSQKGRRLSARKFQSTLPRGERPKTPKKNTFNSPISIHAPARGATGFALRSSSMESHFNPRSREGSDRLKMIYCQ